MKTEEVFERLDQLITDLNIKVETLADQAKRADREEWLTMEQACACTKLNHQTLRRYRKEIGSSQPTGGKNLIFKRGDLEDWFYRKYVKKTESHPY